MPFVEHCISLYTETSLHNSQKPEGFIDPFHNIEKYGPLGDRFSLSVLRPKGHQDRTITILHRDQRYSYVVSASLAKLQNALYKIAVKVDQQNHFPGGPQHALGSEFGEPDG